MKDTPVVVHDTDPQAPARFVTEELLRLDDARLRQQVITVTPVEPVYKDGNLKAVRARVGVFMAVLPISLIDKTAVDTTLLCGRPLPILIERLPTRQSDLVLNHKAAVERLRLGLFKSLRVGGVRRAVVADVGRKYEPAGAREFGVFVDLGWGLCGLAHVSSIPSSQQPLVEHFQKGDSVLVYPLRIGRDRQGKRRIELRLQQ